MQGLTNTMLFMAISLVMYIVAGASVKLCVKVLIVYSVIAGSIYGISEVIAAHRLEELSKNEVVAESAQEEKGKESQLRTDTWASRFNSYFKEVLDTCPSKNESILSSQQKTYSYMAQANGGWYGVGLGQSRETSRLPLAFSDYVYSIVIEESGFIGGTLLLALFFSLMMRAAYIARRCKQAYPALLVMGMAAMIVLQAFSHIAINTGIVPVSGQNLPLISKGGTSVLVICMAFGVIINQFFYFSSLLKEIIISRIASNQHFFYWLPRKIRQIFCPYFSWNGYKIYTSLIHTTFCLISSYLFITDSMGKIYNFLSCPLTSFVFAPLSLRPRLVAIDLLIAAARALPCLLLCL